jgi:hypothetical protein
MLLDLLSLVYRRYRGDAIEVYKYLRGVYKVDSSSLLPLTAETRTRGHGFKLLKRHFFSMRVVNLWNSLPDDVVTAPTLNTFKNRIDKTWKHIRYKLDVPRPPHARRRRAVTPRPLAPGRRSDMTGLIRWKRTLATEVHLTPFLWYRHRSGTPDTALERYFEKNVGFEKKN